MNAVAQVRRSMRDPWTSMPLTLVTGPANAEKAGPRPGRLPGRARPRAAARRADRCRRRALPARARRRGRRLRRAGHALRLARARDRAALGGLRPAARAARARARGRRGRRRGAARPPRRIGRDAGLPARVPAARRRARGAADRARAVVRGPAGVGGRGARAGGATPRSWARSTAPTATRSSALGRPDARLHALAALDALRLDPARWGGTPVFLYGFDDLTPLQRDAVETLAIHCRADVMLSLTYEPGRAAFAGRGATFQELLALGAEHVPLEARADHYASLGLHDLERGLFETGAEPVRRGRRRRAARGRRRARRARARRRARGAADPRGGRRAGGDRGRAARARGARAAAGRRVRRPPACRSRCRGAFAAGHTALGRGLLGLLRCAVLDGTADDLLAWLRTPGKLERPALADRLEADARRNGARTAAEARALWEAAHPGFVAHRARPRRRRARERPGGAVRAARGRGGRALRGAVAGPGAGADRLGRARRPRRGRAARGARRARRPGRAGPGARAVARPTSRGRSRTSRPSPATARGRGRPARSRSPRPTASAPAASARSTSAACRRASSRGRDGPSRSSATPSARELNAASRPAPRAARGHARGRAVLLLRRGVAADRRARALVARGRRRGRAARALAVRRRRARPARPGARDPAPSARRGRLRRGARADRARAAAARGSRRRAPPGAARPPRSRRCATPRVLAALRERETWSASALEAWTGLPGEVVRRPAAVARGPRARPRAAAARRARPPRARGGDARPRRRRRRPRARAPRRGQAPPARGARAPRRRTPASRVNPERLRAAVRRLEADLVRYVEHAAHAGSELEPAHFELRFGGAGDELPAVELAGGELRLAGRIDRIDAVPGAREAIVYDYKGRSAPPSQARWIARGQAPDRPLHARRAAAARARGRRRALPAARAPRTRARAALLREDADPGLDAVRTDRLRRGGVRGAPAGGPRRRARGRARDPLGRARAAAGHVRVERRLRAPLDLPVRDVTALAHADGRPLGAGGRAFTDEQAAAIERRDGPLLLSASAGLGQDVRARRALRALGRRGRAAPGAGPRDHVHRQGGGRAALARARAAARARRARARARHRGARGS